MIGEAGRKCDVLSHYHLEVHTLQIRIIIELPLLPVDRQVDRHILQMFPVSVATMNESMVVVYWCSCPCIGHRSFGTGMKVVMCSDVLNTDNRIMRYVVFPDVEQMAECQMVCR